MVSLSSVTTPHALPERGQGAQCTSSATGIRHLTGAGAKRKTATATARGCRSWCARRRTRSVVSAETTPTTTASSASTHAAASSAWTCLLRKSTCTRRVAWGRGALQRAPLRDSLPSPVRWATKIRLCTTYVSPLPLVGVLASTHTCIPSQPTDLTSSTYTRYYGNFESVLVRSLMSLFLSSS